jgi:mannose-1-phosphate guanylyltransferase
MLLKNNTNAVVIIEGTRFYPNSISYVPKSFFEKYRERLISSGITPLYEMRETFTNVSVVTEEKNEATEPSVDQPVVDIVEVVNNEGNSVEESTSTKKNRSKRRNK